MFLKCHILKQRLQLLLDREISGCAGPEKQLKCRPMQKLAQIRALTSIYPAKEESSSDCEVSS